MKPEFVFVYTGPHYGRRHRVMARPAGLLVVCHVSTGDVITVHPCDTEPA